LLCLLWSFFKGDGLLKFCIACIIILIIGSSAFAQWQYGGKQIGYGPIGAIGLQPLLAPDDRGGVYVVWTAYLDDRPGREIVLCHFDTAGVSLFGEAGYLITNDSLDQSMPAIAPDGEGGVYLAWTDHRDFTDSRGSVYAQRVNYEGDALWGNGIRLIYNAGLAPDDYPLRGTDIYSDSALGFVAVSKLDTGYQKSVLLAQRVDGSGNLLWDSLGIVIYTGTGWIASNFSQPHLTKSGDDYYCALMGARSEIEGGIYIQKIDTNGVIYFGPQGASVINDIQGGSGNDEDDRAIQILPDGQGGVVVGWLYYNLSLGPTFRADRISPTGQSLWQVNGKRLLPEERSERRGLGLHQIGPDANPNFLAVAFGGYQANYQMVDLSGNLLFGISGDTLCAGRYFDSDEYLDTLYFIQLVGNYYYGSKRDASSNEYWPRSPYIHGWIWNYDVTADKLGGLYVTFTLDRDFYTDYVYMQRIYPDGHFGGDTTAINDNAPAIPEDIKLLQNYPNPFNSSTLLTIKGIDKAEIAIFDITGRRVATLHMVNGQVSWNAEGYSSGAYFARVEGLTIKGQTRASAAQVVRMVLLK
jgi:hypothetical protein